MRRSALAFWIVAVAACTGDRATAPSPPRSLQWVADSLAGAANVPGMVVAMRRAGQEMAVVASGLAELSTRRPLTPGDRFRIGSLTKPMVATVILQLADESRLALDDPLARFLPEALPDADVITVRQLLNHTSGLPDYVFENAFINTVLADPGRSWTAKELLAFVRDAPRSFPPGAPGQWEYSNTNYILLGMIAEAAGGQSLATLLRLRIFEPLGMSSTYYSAEASLQSPYAEGYAGADGVADVPIGTLLNGTIAGAAGAVVSTGADMVRFVEALADGRLVSAQSQAARVATVPGSRVRLPGDSFDTGYGLGVLAGSGWVGHNGAFPGYEALAQAKAGVGSVVVLVNRSTDDFATLRIWLAVRSRFLGPQ